MEKKNEVKRIDLSKSTFVANGKKYHFYERLSLERWMEFERLQPRLGFGKDFKSIWDSLDTAIKFGNTGKGIEGWNLILNLRTSIGDRLDNRIDTAFHICALFINREGENVKTIDQAIMKEKIEDWTKEGYDALDFFQLAANLVTGFVETLKKISPDSSPKDRSK